MDFNIFQSLPAEDVARLVRTIGPQVCVFPVNGTRRWCWLEHTNDPDKSLEHYVEIAALTYIRLFSMLYDHGIDTILSPIYGDELLSRGSKYIQATLANGLSNLETPDFLNFYRQYDICVRFYGNFRTILNKPIYTPQLELFERISGQTMRHKKRRLFFGVFANDAAEQVGELSINHFLKENRYPDRHEIISLYYGEYVEPVTLFIGFEKPTIYDYPLLGLGNESLYFTASPSPYLTTFTLRKILYDHLYRRTIKDPDWEQFSETDFNVLRNYYHKQQRTVLGVGNIFHGTWISEHDQKDW
jgi:adenosine tuberculosinyltransferase